jgi:predicted NAD/FAD-dependent oxidoreductase
MTSVAKDLARDVRIETEQQAVALRRSDDGWILNTASGGSFSARSVILTPPVPQSLAIMHAGDIALNSEEQTRLTSIEYARCLAVMAVLDEPSRVPPPGGLAPTGGPIVWIADNQAKGISSEPALTIHASHNFSVEHWDRDRQETGRLLLEAAKEWLGAGVRTFQVQGWRYSKPLRTDERRCAIVSESPALVLAGDAFAGPRVEGAALSGWAAAEAVLFHSTH